MHIHATRTCRHAYVHGQNVRLHVLKQMFACNKSVRVKCNTLPQHTATRNCNHRFDSHHIYHAYESFNTDNITSVQRCSPEWNTAPYCNTLQDTVTHCNTPQHTAIRCNTLQQDLFRAISLTETLYRTATQCNTLQHTDIATKPPEVLAWVKHYTILQHAATHCNTP